MAKSRSSSSSSWWRYINPAYYLKRPKRLALLFILFVCGTLLVWDRQTLVREHEEEVSKLNDEVVRLQNLLEELKNGQSIRSEKPKNDDKTARRNVNVSDDPVSIQRREKVKNAMIHAWNSYEKYAWGHDELQPQSKTGVDSFGGLGATLIDSLDTLYIMGLDEQFQRAREWVANSLDFNKNYDASVFETTIRVVGGLLSAYDLSGYKVFLEKAKDIADRLLPAWDTPSGIPYNIINLAHGNPHNPGWTGGDSVLADSGTEQLEFIALSQRTGDPKYQQKVENVILELNKTFPDDGLLPIYINPHRGTKSHATITFGAMGDSFYEYLLKVWIQGNKTSAVKHYREMWETSMKGLLSLVRRTTPSSFAYICEKIGSSEMDKMDELACFAPGMIALGSSGYSSDESQKFLSLAEELAWTCYNFYQSTPTKLAGENYFFNAGQDMSVGTSWNILRPETVESLFYLWRLTGNKTYQDWGWNIFEAFEKNSRIESGYVGLKDVNTGVKDNMMQSFFLAETLKYLYLLFSPSSVISLDEWVFNTEAHPIKIVTRHDQKEKFGGMGGQSKADIRTRARKQGRFGDDFNQHAEEEAYCTNLYCFHNLEPVAHLCHRHHRHYNFSAVRSYSALPPLFEIYATLYHSRTGNQPPKYRILIDSSAQLCYSSQVRLKSPLALRGLFGANSGPRASRLPPFSLRFDPQFSFSRCLITRPKRIKKIQVDDHGWHALIQCLSPWWNEFSMLFNFVNRSINAENLIHVDLVGASCIWFN